MTLLDSAKHRIGDTVWFTQLRQPVDHQLGEQYNDMLYEHPMFIFSRTPLRHIWTSGRALPKLDGESFDSIVMLLTGEIVLRSMVIESIERSENTGEFIYYDDELQVCLPEQVLYLDRRGADRERTRILRMIRDWATAQLEAKNEMFSMRKRNPSQNRRANRRPG